MRLRIAIVGGGVAAGLAASMLSRNNDVVLFRPSRLNASPIPEIVPRRVFFERAFLSRRAEDRIIQAAETPVRSVTWRKSGGTRTRRLRTDSRYLVYDKGRLAKALLEEICLLDLAEKDVPEIGAVTGFHTVLDCRGAKAVQADPAYRTEMRGYARTRCRYMLAERPDYLDPATMEFWSETTALGHRRTFYIVPVGDCTVSLGCSSHPSDPVGHEELMLAARAAGVEIAETAIRVLGEAEPRPTVTRKRLSQVYPLGDANGLPCPLTEYGTLKALSQLAVMCGGQSLPHDVLARPISSEVDPHIPMELFA
ncbi:hypothetical protein [Swaminathania salitolerans]|uniref:Uncharacterized protein n=1 Tax=Swaminathania salitolerans TaxID=182838 RepID=A0A511BSW1_9PROT|nr:hypothetical protein [Swaminathania salitolerans]GBQ09292.1 hypothetical protein AA21291_0016 [Swaminathania salitolerans LMG 21291]GEL01028.1 hypothetical protein SSA02_01910 [Swaminathania salitolerans]